MDEVIKVGLHDGIGALIRRDIEFALPLLACAQNKAILACSEMAATYKSRE